MRKVMVFLDRYWAELFFVTCLFIFMGCFVVFTGRTYMYNMAADISQEVVRFHVLANSDTKEDQMLKMNVRDEVLAYMAPVLKDSPSIEETKVRITAHMDDINQVAAQVIANWGKDYTVRTELARADFPTKTYGDIVFPAGNYEACRIIIGEGAGQNWWCVMFPPLCYVDATTGVVPLEGKAQLQENLTPEQYEIVANQAERPHQVRFKVMEWLGK